MSFFIFLLNLLWSENGLIKEWNFFYFKDTLYLIYTLENKKSGRSEEIFSIKIKDEKIIKKEMVYKNKNGIYRPYIFLDKNGFIFYSFQIGKKFKEKNIFLPYSLNIIFKGKKYEIFKGSKKRPFLGNYDFFENYKFIENSGEIHLLDEKNKIIHTLKGVRPVKFKDYIYYIKGIEGSPNSLVRTNINSKRFEEEIIFDKEIVLLIKESDDILFFLTDPDVDLFPENLYMIYNSEPIKIWSDTLHIIFPPSATIINDTIYILLSLSSILTPEYLYLGKFSLKDKNINWKKLLKNINGLEARWLKFPYFILLIRLNNYVSIFKITSLL